jgi:hypothetical protein
LSKDYLNQTEIGLFLKNIFGIPLLNKEDVEKCFVENCMTKGILPENQKLNQFMDY